MSTLTVNTFFANLFNFFKSSTEQSTSRVSVSTQDSKSEPTILTSEEFIEHLCTDGDFEKFGKYIVYENISLPEKEILPVINLCEGSFSLDFKCNKATFKSIFYCDNSHFNTFYCNTATFDAFDCGTALFKIFNCLTARFENGFTCNSASFLNSFLCGNAYFGEGSYQGFDHDDYLYGFQSSFCCVYAKFLGKFDCGNAIFNGTFHCHTAQFTRKFSCGTPMFKDIEAKNNYAVGMVIHYYKSSGVQFSLDDFKKD